MNPAPTENQSPASDRIVQPARRPHVPRVLEISLVVLVLGVFASVCLPVFNSVAVRGQETKALAQAKQIGLALKIFAGDNDGRYPTKGVPVEMTSAPTTSNAAFACLFPIYTNSKIIFGNRLSAYQTRAPDNVVNDPSTGTVHQILEPGENVYGYVMGLTDNSPPRTPLVVDGTDGTGHYGSDPTLRGGVWGGKTAIVIRLDNSGALELLAGPANARFIPRSPEMPTENLLDVPRLGKDVRLLDPAIPAHGFP